MSTKMNYSTSSIPLVVPKECAVFAEQDLFNVMKCLAALNAQNNFLVCLRDIRCAMKFIMRIMPKEMTDIELYKSEIYWFDDNDEGEEDEDEKTK